MHHGLVDAAVVPSADGAAPIKAAALPVLSPVGQAAAVSLIS